MSKPDWGYIYTRCPVCGGMNRILVTFPAFNKPFNPRTYECHMCGAYNLASDPHTYDDEGHIIDSDYFSDIDKAEIHKQFVEDYENRPDVQAGWAQQDLIDLRRREQ